MDPTISVITFVVSYLLGSISFARVVSRVMAPGADLDDVEFAVEGAEEGMRMTAMGGNTVSMKLGARAGCAVGFLDILKVFVPTLVFRLLYPDQYYFLIAAVAGFIGHCWPIYYRFKGGRGISAFYGGIFAFDPIGGLVAAIGGMFIGMVLLKELLIAYSGGVLLIIPWLWFTTHDFAYLAYALIINLLFILAMLPEIRQIREFRRKYGKGDIKVSMEQFPMGRSMLKIMNLISLRKQDEYSKGE
jgi:glycerol-3-phosphate acyltransferase PlsY